MEFGGLEWGSRTQACSKGHEHGYLKLIFFLLLRLAVLTAKRESLDSLNALWNDNQAESMSLGV